MNSETLTEEQALVKANTIFQNVKQGKNGKKDVKEMNKAFKREMERLGINRKGRPSTGRKKRKSASFNSTDAFANAFPMTGDLAPIFAQVQEEANASGEVAERARKERKAAHQQQKVQATWHATWHRANPQNPNPLPPVPPQWGCIHPLPFRPYTNQPQVPLPQGHQYGTLPPSL
jgi:hypothetical protein